MRGKDTGSVAVADNKGVWYTVAAGPDKVTLSVVRGRFGARPEGDTR